MCIYCCWCLFRCCCTASANLPGFSIFSFVNWCKISEPPLPAESKTAKQFHFWVIPLPFGSSKLPTRAFQVDISFSLFSVHHMHNHNHKSCRITLDDSSDLFGTKSCFSRFAADLRAFGSKLQQFSENETKKQHPAQQPEKSATLEAALGDSFSCCQPWKIVSAEAILPSIQGWSFPLLFSIHFQPAKHVTAGGISWNLEL